MKIEWLNEKMTEARLTRGFWWWKRVAIVDLFTATKPHKEPKTRWRYTAANIWVDDDLHWKLTHRSNRDKTWHKTVILPTARVLNENPTTTVTKPVTYDSIGM